MNNTSKSPSTQNTVLCPECDTPFTIPENAAEGTIIECLACGTESEFVTIHPPTLAPLEEEK